MTSCITFFYDHELHFFAGCITQSGHKARLGLQGFPAYRSDKGRYLLEFSKCPFNLILLVDTNTVTVKTTRFVLPEHSF